MIEQHTKYNALCAKFQVLTFTFSILDIKFVCTNMSRAVIVTCKGHDYMIIQQTNLSYCTFFLQFSHRLLFYAKDDDIWSTNTNLLVQNNIHTPHSAQVNYIITTTLIKDNCYSFTINISLQSYYSMHNLKTNFLWQILWMWSSFPTLQRLPLPPLSGFRCEIKPHATPILTVYSCSWASCS